MHRLLPILALLLAPSAWAQGFFYKIDPPAPDATIRICPMTSIGPTTNPCVSPAPIYNDMALTSPARNPVSLGPDGAYAFWIAAGQYFLQYSGSTSTRTVVFEFGGTGGGGTTPSWFLSNSLVGTEPNYDVIPGTNVTITGTDDPGATRVHYTVNASGGGGGGGITPCIAGATHNINAAWSNEPANVLAPNVFNNPPHWSAPTGWIPINTGGTDLCASLFMALPGTSDVSPLMVGSSGFNRIITAWGPNFGFHIGTCEGLGYAGYSALFPPDSGCISALGHYSAFYSQTWNNTNIATGSSCADQLSPPAVLCTDGATGKVARLTPNGISSTPGTFTSIGACGAGTEGTSAPVINSTTNTWGATITGGGTFHVLAYCNGTNWTVAAK